MPLNYLSIKKRCSHIYIKTIISIGIYASQWIFIIKYLCIQFISIYLSIYLRQSIRFYLSIYLSIYLKKGCLYLNIKRKMFISAYLTQYVHINRSIKKGCSCLYQNLYFHSVAVRVFANGPGDLGSISGWVIPKTQKMVLDASLLNTQHYKVRIKGKVEQSWERSSALPYTLV